MTQGNPLAVALIACTVGCSANSTTGGANAGSTVGGAGNSATGGNAGGAAGHSGSAGGNAGAATASAGMSSAGMSSAGMGSGGTQNSAGASTGGSAGGAAGGTAGNLNTAGGGGVVNAGEPAVRFIGRIDESDIAGPKFAWSGSGILARFSGTQVGVTLAGGQEYTVVLDGTVQPKIAPGDGVTPIASNLAAGEHSIELYRRTEANGGVSQFLGFDFGGGALLPPAPAPDRRIEVIGDSITCGYGNEGTFPCSFSYETENHYQTYEAIAARAVGAEPVTIAWSGKGVMCNYGDDPCADPLPDYYDLTLPGDPTSIWDFSKWQPNAVVINLGTNDFSTAVDPTDQEFIAAYVALLTRIRTHYPDALILCTNGPMLGGTDLTTVRSDIDAAITQLNDPKIKSFEFMPQTGDVGCDYHPNIATHQAMASVLTAELQSELGW